MSTNETKRPCENPRCIHCHRNTANAAPEHTDGLGSGYLRGVPHFWAYITTSAGREVR